MIGTPIFLCYGAHYFVFASMKIQYERMYCLFHELSWMIFTTCWLSCLAAQVCVDLIIDHSFVEVWKNAEANPQM